MKKIIYLTLLMTTISLNILKADVYTENKEVLDALAANVEAKEAVLWEFTQTDNSGSHKGHVVISQPGLVRIEYSDLPMRVIATKEQIMFQDLKTNGKSYLPSAQVPLFTFLSQEHMSFQSEHLKLINYKLKDGVHTVTMASTYNPKEILIVYIAEKEYKVLRWAYTNSKQTNINVIINTEYVMGRSLEKSIFSTGRISELDIDGLAGSATLKH